MQAASSRPPAPARLGRLVARLLLSVLALVGLAAGALFLSAEPLEKPELEQRLFALDKNRAVTELRRLPLTVDFGGGPVELELVYHFAPAQDSTASGRPVVLVHGTPSTLFSWSELIHGAAPIAEREGFQGLAASRDVYALEVLGHGIAPGRVDELGFEDCARFVVAALRALDLERVHLVGSSYGGEFVWRAALNAPERIASVALLDPSGLERRAADWLPEEVAMRENPLADLGWLLNSRERIEVALAPHFRELPPDRVEEFTLVCANPDNWSAMVDLARDENGERAAELADLTAPTLLLWGAEDVAYVPEYYAERFARVIPTAELVLIPDTGHYPHEERPREVIRLLESFFTAQELER